MTDNRLAGADFVRAAACLTVMFHHLTQKMDGKVDFGPILNGFRVFAQMGTFGVAMFFVLSGFLLARPFWTAYDAGTPMPSLGLYAWRRAARILPGYWLSLVITFVLTITVFDVAFDGELLLRFVTGFFLVADWHWVTFFPVEINGPLWSISFEVTAYVLLPLGFLAVFAGRPRAGRWGGRLIFAGVIALAIFCHWLMWKFYPIDDIRRGWDYGAVGGAKYWMPRYNPFALFAMFAFGAMAAGIHVRIAKLRHIGFDLLALAAAIAAILVLQRHVWLKVDPSGFGWLGAPYGFPWFQLAVAAFLAVIPSSRWLGRMLDAPPVTFIATISFGIYIWHTLVIELVRVWWVPNYVYWGMSEGGFYTLVTLGITVGSLLCGWLSWRLIEAPVMAWARGKEGAMFSGAVPAVPKAAEGRRWSA